MTEAMKAHLLDEVREMIAEREREGIVGLAAEVAPAQWAELIPRLDGAELATLVGWLPDQVLADTLAEINPAEAAQILRAVSRGTAADILEQMDPDDATDVVGQLGDAEAEQILVEMEPADAAEIRELLVYPADTAGGIMTPAFVAVRADITVEAAERALRRRVGEAETVYYVYVVDDDGRLMGVLALHRLVLVPPRTKVRDVMVSDVIRVRADADRETAARLLTDHNFLALPVVDDRDRLLGIITQDDVADVLEAEATEDFERIGGSEPLAVPYRLASVAHLFRRRIVWLLLLFIAQAYTGTVIRAFEDTLQAQIILAAFIPLLIGTGGNVGSQTVTLIVRAIALAEVRLADVGWIIWKEIRVGLLIGAVMGVVAFLRGELLGVGSDVGAVVALTIVAICLWSATVAAVLPLALRRLRIDPAVVSAPLITTVVDGTGLVIYFEIARLVLRV
ncbi:MAG: magnesium transporter [Chloroflexota bacterium]|nr:magnesium transporter [Chloroflexota bacterium]